MTIITLAFLLLLGTQHSSQRRVLPLRYSKSAFAQQWEERENPLLSKQESSYLSLNRMGVGTIQRFLDWWEVKYKVSDRVRERLYVGHESPSGSSGRYWKSLSPQARKNLRLSWYRKNSHRLMGEMRLFVVSTIAFMHPLKEKEHQNDGDEHTKRKSELKNHMQSGIRQTYER